jgi:phospholipase/carboxylesterase
MEDQALDDLVALIPSLLRALESLSFISRYLNPPDLPSLMRTVGEPDRVVRETLPRLEAWPEHLEGAKGQLQIACAAVCAAYDGLRLAAEQPDAIRGAYRALGQLPKAQEALYPLASDLPPVSRYYLTPDVRQDGERLRRLAEAPPRDDTGVLHAGEPGVRGGFSAYVPEDVSAERAAPLVVALHGGAGNGRGFLWSWLRDARAHGAVLISPTASGETWALQGYDNDTPNLRRIVDWAKANWSIDPDRILLTGMSDGGTFSYVSGLEADSPFTHLAPVSAAFHPMLAQMADADRLQGLPIYLVHGALDWMFPIAMAREAHSALSAAGAEVTYREIDDLAHTYPREVNPDILAWMAANPRGA